MDNETLRGVYVDGKRKWNRSGNRVSYFKASNFLYPTGSLKWPALLTTLRLVPEDFAKTWALDKGA